jgi:hypothetical protein
MRTLNPEANLDWGAPCRFSLRYCFERPVCACLRHYRRCLVARSRELILDLDRVVKELKQERARLDRAIAALDESVSPTVSARKTRVVLQHPAAIKKTKRGGMTPEGRKRLSLAMKKRWAERRKNAS